MATRKEITKKYARQYASAAKKDKGRMLDELVGVTGWSRTNARRAITTASKCKGAARAAVRKPRAPVYGYDTLNPRVLRGGFAVALLGTGVQGRKPRRWHQCRRTQELGHLRRPRRPIYVTADAGAAFEGLGRSQRYAVILPLLMARTPETRARVLARAVDRLAAQK